VCRGSSGGRRLSSSGRESNVGLSFVLLPCLFRFLNQTEALSAVVGLSSSEGESSSSSVRGSVFGSPPLLVPVLLPPVALDVPPAPVKPLAVSG
jgi:hypothetical protein